MNLGEWNGRQLIDREYMSNAVSKQIDTAMFEGMSEMSHGYGYQIWCLKEGGFAFYGMGGQYALCMPKYDAILITTADTQGQINAGEVVFDAYARLLKTFTDVLPENAKAQSSLQRMINGLKIPLPSGSLTTPHSANISGRIYNLEENNAKIKWLRLLIEENKCRMQYENASGEHELVFGMGEYIPQLFPEKYFGRRIGTKDTQYQCICAGAWAEDKTFLGTIYAVDDYFGSINLQLTFVGNEVCGYMKKAAEAFFDEYQGFISGKA